MEEVFKKAIYCMLPDNKLRNLRMKNLIIKD
jgi:ribosomal protein L13